ncbi:chorismate dehydratase [bacterium BMS3Abin09]|nr:chorismate dehydratase [bacterium BMS3Abin09]GBE41900.1 chorismate dehydratase [bacterium BMS3Bbin09]
MKNNKLKIGRIPYANLFPIFYYLDKKCDNSDYRFIKGVPSKVNRMLREGEIDVSPSSSIEYLRNKDKYLVLPWFSISSSGPIKSILLFSKCPIDELGGKTIAISSESETSIMLLKIILKEFFSLDCRFEQESRRSVRNILTSFPAMLHIGDTAMIEAHKLSLNERLQSSMYVYDLGELWDKYTGLPFVFALWVVRKQAAEEKGDLIRKLSDDLIKAGKFASRKFKMIAWEAPLNKSLSEKELVEYWKLISYDFSEKQLEGLNLFEKYAKRL